MSRAGIRFRKYAILLHRWLGVCFCALFALWFVSGIVLMYWTYPEVGAAERLARSAPLDAAQVRIPPEQAFARLQLDGPPARARLTMLDGRPVYRFLWNGDPFLVHADTGDPVEEIPAAMARRIASEWTGQPAAAALQSTLDAQDQWTVSEEFSALRPFWKYRWPDGEEVYVSQVTGEVAQYTTRGSRLGAYLGAIPHWLYFTPLRRRGSLWNRVVVWSSGAGTIVSLLGLTVGLLLYSPSQKRYRFPRGRSGIPYAGQKRWHTILGLIFGLVTCTWVFSGMLSMDPFGWEEGARTAVGRTLRGRPSLPGFAAKSPAEALRQAASGLRVKELDLASFSGEPVYVASESPGRSLVIPVNGAPHRAFPRDRVMALVGQASRPFRVAETRLVDRYEAYYLDRHGERPLPVLFVRLDDQAGSMYYIDLRTARVVQSYTGTSRMNRWLYHGLHSMDLPWLYRHRPAWDLVVLTLMLGGTALSVTSLVIAWRRLRHKLGMWRARTETVPRKQIMA